MQAGKAAARNAINVSERSADKNSSVRQQNHAVDPAVRVDDDVERWIARTVHIEAPDSLRQNQVLETASRGRQDFAVRLDRKLVRTWHRQQRVLPRWVEAWIKRTILFEPN